MRGLFNSALKNIQRIDEAHSKIANSTGVTLKKQKPGDNDYEHPSFGHSNEVWHVHHDGDHVGKISYHKPKYNEKAGFHAYDTNDRRLTHRPVAKDKAIHTVKANDHNNGYFDDSHASHDIKKFSHADFDIHIDNPDHDPHNGWYYKHPRGHWSGPYKSSTRAARAKLSGEDR